MSNKGLNSPRRRRLLAGVGAGLVALGTGVGPTTAQSSEVSVTLDNVGASAWEVTAIDGDDQVAETGVENPELTLREGVRYTFENNGWSAHPLAFRSADGEALLSQSADGSFEGDSETDWVDDDESVSFTLTGELADELDNYICTVHSSMEGSIRTVQAQDSDAPAAVEFSDQSTDGTAVVVDSARLDDGGFVTIHDSTLLDGDALGSVVGVSEVLDAGSYENLTVELDDPLVEGDTLIAMPHRDSNDDGSYGFVETGGDVDGPYSFDGSAVTDDADVQVDGAAAVLFSDQTSDGTAVTVDFARMDDGGFVTIHDSTLLDGDALGSVVGVSEYLAPGSNEDIEVAFDEELTESDTLIAMPHRDTNGNEEYDFVDSGADDDAPYMTDDGAVTDSAEVQVDAAVTAEITFGRQATASSTFTAEDPSTPGVLASGVSADADSAVVVTYEDGEDLVIAGLDTFTASELDGGDVVIPVEDAGGFPGEHVAHVIPLDGLSGEYAPGDTVSAGTAGAVAANDGATVLQATIDFEDQTGEGPVAAGDVMATVDATVADGAGGETPYTVDVHPTDGDGNPVGPEYVGSTMVLTGENPEAEIVAEAVPEDGDRNGLPFEGTGTFVAMIHLPDADTEAGMAATPGSFPVLPNIDGESGPVPAGVTDRATVTAEVSDDDGDGMDGDGSGDDGSDGGMDGGDDGSGDDGMDGGDDGMDGGMDGDTSADDNGPGFGPMAGVAGLGGLAAYAYRKLGLDDEPATPEDDGLEETDE
jgi:hypothetical protein